MNFPQKVNVTTSIIGRGTLAENISLTPENTLTPTHKKARVETQAGLFIVKKIK
jgi:hypothetical protein